MESVQRGLKNRTIRSILDWGSNVLADGGIESPRLNCEILLSYLMHCKRIDLRTKYETSLAQSQLVEFESLIDRRLRHEPVQYITGETEFMGLNIAVGSGVFIPRPETEILVEQAVQTARSLKYPPRNLLEVGTGSGNIAISLATFLPECHIDSIELNEKAIEVARKNISSHLLEGKVTVRKGDILKDDLRFEQEYDLIVSNPPYVSQSDYDETEPEVRDYEPADAVTDGTDGLTFYRKIATLSGPLLNPEGWLLVEIAYNQAKPVAEIFRNCGFEDLDTIKDLSGLPRVVKARKGAAR